MKLTIAPDTEEIVLRCTLQEAHELAVRVSTIGWANRLEEAIVSLGHFMSVKARRVDAVEVERKLARDLAGADDDCG